ncbi:MAG: hypothetical protein LBR22_03055 [Desulfovibrio sp.]|jgi:hypothetical protein|nr:hypothetical protein [Desulfovibrio sp.]
MHKRNQSPGKAPTPCPAALLVLLLLCSLPLPALGRDATAIEMSIADNTASAPESATAPESVSEPAPASRPASAKTADAPPAGRRRPNPPLQGDVTSILGNPAETLAEDQQNRWLELDGKILRVLRERRWNGDVRDGDIWRVDVAIGYTGADYLRETSLPAFGIVRKALDSGLVGKGDSVEMHVYVPEVHTIASSSDTDPESGPRPEEVRWLGPAVMLLWDLRRLRETRFADKKADMDIVFLDEVQQSKVLPMLGDDFRRDFATSPHLRDFHGFIVKTRIAPSRARRGTQQAAPKGD